MPESLRAFDLRLIVLPLAYCNYRCVFCHCEGLSVPYDGSLVRGIDPAEAREMVAWLRPFGLCGLTVSGGEPLLEIDSILRFVEAVPPLPTTVVTNGTRLVALMHELSGLAARPWRIKINFPSFARERYQRLTGQTRYGPGEVLRHIPAALATGANVSLNCVVCRGSNDSAADLRDYVARAVGVGRVAVRFLLQADATEAEAQAIRENLKLESPVYLRGGRIESYSNSSGLVIEVVRCESVARTSSRDGVADLYVTTRRTMKIGLWGQEHAFRGLDEFRRISAAFLA